MSLNEKENNKPNPNNFIELLPSDVRHIIEDPDLSEEKKKSILNTLIGISIHKTSSFEGPLPPPEILIGYNEVVENGADRIISLAEKQSHHRMQLEDYAIKEELNQSRNGQLFGFILGLVGMLLATILALYGHETIAGIFGTTTIVGLVTVFVIGKKMQKNESDEQT